MGCGIFWSPHRIRTRQPITKKFVTGDYVGDPYGCAKFGANPSMGGEYNDDFYLCYVMRIISVDRAT